MGAGLPGIDFQRTMIAFHRLGYPARVLLQFPQVMMRLGLLGIQLQYPVEFFPGRIELVFLQQENARIQEYLDIARMAA